MLFNERQTLGETRRSFSLATSAPPLLVSSPLTAQHTWVRRWRRRRQQAVRSDCFAFAVLCFLLSCWGVGFSTGSRLVRAVPSVPTLPPHRQLLWAGAWLEQHLVCLLFPTSVLLWLLVDLCSSCPAR